MSSSPTTKALLERPLSKALSRPEAAGGLVFDPRQPRAAHEAVLALAAAERPVGLIEYWTALAAADPASAGETWFQATRRLGRRLDPAALDVWIDATRRTVLALATDKLRVERYADLFTVAYENELRRWTRNGTVATAVRETSPPEVTLPMPQLGGLMEALRGRVEANGGPLKVVLTQPETTRLPRIAPGLRALRNSQFTALGWSEFMLTPAPAPGLMLLPRVRFAAFTFDHRGAIVFDGDCVAPAMLNEHYMLDMLGHVPAAGPVARHVPLAFAPVSACPLNHYHELMDTLGSMAFYALLPPGTPVIVPKRYDILRPLYEAAGIDWSLVQEYEEVADTLFAQVVAPVQEASRAGYAAFLRNAAARMVPPGTGRRRFYLSRSKVRNRPLDNEDEIERIVRAHGFEILHVQDIDVIEACRLMAQAEIVLGPHGAAFSNIVFAPENALVIEMLSPDYKAAAVVELAADAGLGYLPLVGSGFTHHPGNEQSWRIDPALVEAALGQALAVADAPAPEADGPVLDGLAPEALRDLMVEHAAQSRVHDMLPALQTLLALHPQAAVDTWFAATRLLGRGLDRHAMRFWMDRTKDAVVAHAPDKLRVERYGYLYRDAAAHELESWREPGSGRLPPVRTQDAAPERQAIVEPLPGSLIAHRRSAGPQVLTVPPRPLPEPVAMDGEIGAFRARQMALLGLEAEHTRPAPQAELFMLPEARFTTFTADDRGGIVFSGNTVAPELCNEHYMLDMLGHYRPVPLRRRLPLAFAPVSACPLNHYHELMDTFSSLAFYNWLPKNTPIVVPRRYEILRPVYEAAGIDWALVQDYAQVADATFEIVVAPREGGSRSYLRPFIERVFHRNVVLPRRNRRLYLSRRGVPERMLDNEAEIEAMAQRHGFEIVHVQTMSALEQAKLAASAEIILAPHGAALSNILFARDATTVIEIMPRDYVVAAVSELARDCRLGWLPVAGSPFQDTHSTAKRWSVDCATVEQAVSLAIDALPRHGSGWRRSLA